MKDKTQYEAFMEELKKLANNFKDVVTELGDILAKILPDVEIPEKEEDIWEMKCPYEYGDKHYCIQSSGDVFLDSWKDIEADNSFFSQGNIFPTREAAELEAKRRNLLTRFRAFRDECNGDWKPDWKDNHSRKYYFALNGIGLDIQVAYSVNCFENFGYFKEKENARKAIELFGDEIEELFVECE